jgi:hypothetical protein
MKRKLHLLALLIRHFARAQLTSFKAILRSLGEKAEDYTVNLRERPSYRQQLAELCVRRGKSSRSTASRTLPYKLSLQ